MVGGRGKFTVSYLEGSTSTKPTPEESKLVSLALRDLNTYNTTGANKLLVHAVRWKDWEMYQKIISASGAHKKIGIIPELQLMDAWKVFSFEKMRSM